MPIFRNTSLVDVGDILRLRERQFDFSIDLYGINYIGKSGNTLDDFILLFGAYEKGVLFFMRDFSKSVLKEPITFLDIGSHVGQHSLFMSSHVGTIHAFDPYPPVIEKFRHMVDINKIENIFIHQIGIGDKDSELPFYEPYETNTGVGTFRESVTDYEERKVLDKLKIVKGDSWVKENNIENIKIIKIDIEGFEEYALRGLNQTLNTHRPLIILEVSKPTLGTISNLSELKKLLPNEYTVFSFVIDIDFFANGKYRLIRIDEDTPLYQVGKSQSQVLAFPSELAETQFFSNLDIVN